MENLEVKVKELADENERLKGENTKLLTRIHTLEMEVGDEINSMTKA
jgi:cell division protein FtsB